MAQLNLITKKKYSNTPIKPAVKHCCTLFISSAIITPTGGRMFQILHAALFNGDNRQPTSTVCCGVNAVKSKKLQNKH